MGKMTYFPVKNFRGVESKIDARDAGKGGMIRLEGALIYPWWAISSGPYWQNAFSTANIGAAIDAAMQSAGLSATKVHFATVANNLGQTFLVAWDRTWQVCVGFWHVDQLNEVFSPGSAAVITVNTSSAWNNYTSGIFWYGTWVGQRLWIGNGTDANVVFDGVAATLSVLGPASAPNDPQDPSQYRIPPCAAWARNTNGEVFAASCNPSAYPLRVYITEPPNKSYPYPTGIKDPITSNVTSSSVDIVAAEGACITALQDTELGIVVHLTIGPPVLLDNVDGVDDGWRANQRPMKKAPFCAINQNCASNSHSEPFYLGQNYELYQKNGDELVTAKSSTFWNRAALRAASPQFNQNPMVLFDRRSNRAWIGMPTIEDDEKMGWWVWDVQNNAISGPIRYPNMTAATMMRTNTTGASIAAGMTAAGALLCADVNLIDEPVLPEPGTPLDVPYRPTTAVPTPNLSIPYIGINAAGNGFTYENEGYALQFTNPWADIWIQPQDANVGQVVVPAYYFNNATLAVIELLEEDFGSPVDRKNFMEVRVQWRRNQIAYCGVFVEADGQRDGQWMGTAWTNQEMVCHINLTGTRMRLRVIAVFFNDQQAMLPDLTVGYYPVAPR